MGSGLDQFIFSSDINPLIEVAPSGTPFATLIIKQLRLLKKGGEDSYRGHGKLPKV